MTSRRLGGVIGLALAGSLALPGPAAALLAWSLSVTPLSTTAGQTTTFSMTATNLDLLNDLGCLEVTLGSAFQNVSVGTPTASNGDPWTASVSGSTVVVWSLSGGGRLDKGANQSVTFAVTALPTVAGVFVWPHHAHARQDCTGADELSLLPVSVTVLPAPTPSPAPTTPTPTPILPLPTPTLPLPTLVSSPTPTPAPTVRPPTTATPSPTPNDGPRSASPTPSASIGAPGSEGPSGTASVAPSASPGTDAPIESQSTPGGTAGGADPGAGGRPAVRFDDGGALDVGVGSIGLLDGVEIWAVPAATIAVPGVIVLLWVALQTAGAIAWIPAVRRLRRGGQMRARLRT